MALTEVKILVATVLPHVTFSLGRPAEEVTYTLGLVMPIKDGLPCKVSARGDSKTE